MKKIIGVSLKALLFVLMMVIVFTPAAFAEEFENQDLTITTKRPPQYLGWKLHVGSTTQTAPFYYKVAAMVTGIGETMASPVTIAYATYSPLSSTNSLRIMWAPTNGATSYQLYKSLNNVAFYLLTNTTGLTYIDAGAALGAAYSAPNPRGGNLKVENSIAVGKHITVAGDLTLGAANYRSTMTASNGNWAITGGVTSLGTITGDALTAAGTVVGAVVRVSGQVLLGNATSAELAALVPGQAKGAMIINSTTNGLCQSTATAVGSWVLAYSTTTACY